MTLIKNPLTIVQTGGGVAKPQTWAEFKATGTSELSAIYPAGSVIDNLPCSVKRMNNLSTSDDYYWVVENYGTTRLEGDDTDYPCAELVALRITPFNLAFDGPEQVLCDSTTETTAEDGVYYYGTSVASGNIAANNTTALELSTGDAIPYEDYARIFKSSIDTTNTNFANMWLYGYNNYALSNIRQALNADVASGWFTASHVGDALSTTYNSMAGFLHCLPDDFKAVLSATKVDTALNTVTDGGTTVSTYDKIFLPSLHELRLMTTPVEGNQFVGITMPERRCKSAVNSQVTGQTSTWWTRSAYRTTAYYANSVSNSGSSSTSTANLGYPVAPACRIILPS